MDRRIFVQPVNSLKILVLQHMAKKPLKFIDLICNDLAEKLCEMSDPDVIFPYLSKSTRGLQVCSKLQTALILYTEVSENKENYEKLDAVSKSLSSSPSANILIACNAVVKTETKSLEILRAYNRLVDELKEGYLE